MEFATEMIIRASLLEKTIADVPITLHPDDRKSHAPHLQTFRDGWRTLRFFLLLGLLGYAVALPRMVLGIVFDAHTLLFSSLFLLLGHQAILFAVSAQTFAIREGFLPEGPLIRKFYQLVNLERGLIMGAGALVAGAILLAVAVYAWWQTGFGQLDYAQTMRIVIPGATLTTLGFQTVLSSFFVSLLGMGRC